MKTIAWLSGVLGMGLVGYGFIGVVDVFSPSRYERLSLADPEVEWQAAGGAAQFLMLGLWILSLVYVGYLQKTNRLQTERLNRLVSSLSSLKASIFLIILWVIAGWLFTFQIPFVGLFPEDRHPVLLVPFATHDNSFFTELGWFMNGVYKMFFYLFFTPLILLPRFKKIGLSLWFAPAISLLFFIGFFATSVLPMDATALVNALIYYFTFIFLLLVLVLILPELRRRSAT